MEFFCEGKSTRRVVSEELSYFSPIRNLPATAFDENGLLLDSVSLHNDLRIQHDDMEALQLNLQHVLGFDFTTTLTCGMTMGALYDICDARTPVPA